jgi:DNA ligase-1
MCIVDEKGNEDFTAMIKLIRKKNFTIDNPRYKIFDVIPLEDFLNKKGNTRFYIRYEACQKIKSKSGILDPVKQVKIKNEEHFTELTAEASEKGWEGLIIRKNVFYEGKRTKKMLKVKQFHDAEYEVTGVVNEAVRYISKETGLEKEEMMLSSVVIEHEGNRVNVGSGFSLEQRQAFFKDSSLIIGKTITVKYFEESQDKDGKKSLRFPVVKHIFEEKRDV